MDKLFFEKIACILRKKSISCLVSKESHHIGSSMSIIDLLTYLYYREMNIDPDNPKDPKRDVFILSKGHGALALYVTLHSKGFFGSELLDSYDKNGGFLPEHASTIAPGVELSTGSLGHGLSVGIGFAISSLNDEVDKRIFVLMSDGEFNEGSNWEAIMYAGCHKLKNLIVIVDLNKFQGYSETKNVLDLRPLDKKVEMFGWNTFTIDGHNFNEMESVFNKIKTLNYKKPTMIFANTIKGKGVDIFEGKLESHYRSLTEDEIKNVLLNLGS